MDPVGVIEILKRVFTFGDASNTHLDIVRYLNGARIKEATYSKWGRNAFQPPIWHEEGKVTKTKC